MTKKKTVDFDYLDEETEGLKKPAKVGLKSKRLKEKLKACQKEKGEYLTQLQRARADLVNYRRRQEETGKRLRTVERANFIKELLPVLDSLRIGAKGNDDIKQISGQFETILKQNGVEEIKSVGEMFNPSLHEVIGSVELKGKRTPRQAQGKIVEEVQKGYILGDFLIRLSKVKITK